jgi:chemotaxis protein histidine kinase CheA
MSDDEFRQMLAAVSAEYRAGLPARLAGIDALWGQVMRGADAAQVMNDLILALHSIAGSAETFGLTAVGRAAAAAESRLEPYRDARQTPDAASCAEVTRLLEALRLAGGVDAGR